MNLKIKCKPFRYICKRNDVQNSRCIKNDEMLVFFLLHIKLSTTSVMNVGVSVCICANYGVGSFDSMLIEY